MSKIGMNDDVEVNCAESSPFSCLSTSALVLPNNQNSSIVTSTVVPRSTCSGFSPHLGPSKTAPSADGVLPPVPGSTCSGFLWELGPSKTLQLADGVLPPLPDDEIDSLLAKFTNPSIDNDENEEPYNLNHVGNVEDASCLDGNIHNDSGDLGNWADQSGDGFNLSSGHNVEYTMGQILPRDDVFELNDLKSPLKCPAEANGSRHFPIDGLVGPYDSYNKSKHFFYLDNSLAKEFYRFEDSLDVFQKEPNNLNHVGNVEATSCLDRNNIHNDLGHLENQVYQCGDGFNHSNGHNVKYTMGRIIPSDDVLELNDLKSPLKCPADVSGSQHFPINGLLGPYDSYNNSKPLCYLENSFGVQHDFRLSHSRPGAKEFYRFEDSLDVFQKENGGGETENQGCKAASYSVDVTPRKISELGSKCVPQAQKRAYPHGDKAAHGVEGSSPRGPHGLLHYGTSLPPLGAPILHKPEKHISRHALAQELPPGNFRKYGCCSKLQQWYYKLPTTVQAHIKRAGFEPFIQTTIKIQGDQVHLHALVERWWNTTNTFHFPFGEIGITPYDFSVITGVRIGGVPIPYDFQIHERQEDLIEFLGEVPPNISGGSIRYEWLRYTFERRPCITTRDEVILTRVFFLYLLGCSLFCNLGNRVHLYYLPALRDVELIGQYDWGGAAFAVLYTYMSRICRGKITRIGGYWRALEIWSYEYFHVLAPALSAKDDPLVFPRAVRWLTREKGEKNGSHDFSQYRNGFSALTFEQVNWNPWHGMEQILPPEILASRDLSKRRIMFEGPWGGSWFLGERLSMQTLGTAHPMVPAHPPLTMLASKVSAEELAEFRRGYDASYFLNAHKKDYAQFVEEELMAPFPMLERPGGGSVTVGARPSSSQARPSASRAKAGSSQVGGSSLSGGPSWTVFLPSEEGDIQPVDVVRTSSAEGVPLPPEVTQVSRERHEDVLWLVAALKSMVQKAEMKARFAVKSMRLCMRERGTRDARYQESIRELENTHRGTSSSSPNSIPAAHPPIFQRSSVWTSVLPSTVRQPAVAAVPSLVVPKKSYSPSLRHSQREAVLLRGSCAAPPSSSSSPGEVSSDSETEQSSPAPPHSKRSAPSSSKGKGKKRSRNLGTI